VSCIYWEERSYAEFFSCFSGYSRPTSLQDRGRDSDDEDFRDRDYDVAALASNLSQAFKYGIYSNEDIDEVSFSHFLHSTNFHLYLEASFSCRATFFQLVYRLYMRLY